MLLFSAEAKLLLEKFKKRKKKTFAHKKLKNQPKKLHTFGSWEFSFCPKQPRTSFPFNKFFDPTISVAEGLAKVSVGYM